jgi:hypothetical protein
VPLKLRFNEGIFRLSEKPDGGARLFGSFCEGGYPTFDKRNSPEGAKQNLSAHAEAAQECQAQSIADKVRSYES